MNPSWCLFAAFAGALALMLLPAKLAHCARWIAFAASLLSFGAAVHAAMAFVPGNPWRWDSEWIPEFGIRFHLAAPGLAITLLLLTGLVAIAGVLYSWNIDREPRMFHALFLTIIGAVHGVFLSRDVFLLFLFYELVILPKYFLIARWGHGNKEYGAMKLTLYSIASSALIVLGLGLAYAHGPGSFDLEALMSAEYPLELQKWACLLLIAGFGVLAGLWPLHTWAPTGHVAAPTAASMLLAGVVMKLGSYGILVVALPVFPKGFAFWQPVLAVLATIGILHGAFTALTRKDLKFVIAYSSISHMGFVLLGLATAGTWGLRGAVLQMISHGLIAGLLFGIAGRIIHDRVHTRDLGALAKENLWERLPGVAPAFILASAASMGMPGFSGFAAEICVLLGTWSTFPILVPIAVIGVVVTGIFSMRAVNRAILPSRLDGPASSALPAPGPPPPPLSWPEITATALLLAASLAIGLYPQPWLEWINDGLPAIPIE